MVFIMTVPYANSACFGCFISSPSSGPLPNPGVSHPFPKGSPSTFISLKKKNWILQWKKRKEKMVFESSLFHWTWSSAALSPRPLLPGWRVSHRGYEPHHLYLFRVGPLAVSVSWLLWIERPTPQPGPPPLWGVCQPLDTGICVYHLIMALLSVSSGS